MPKSLVTGAAGFIGSHVARSLQLAGQDVVGVDDLSGGFIDNVPAGVRFVSTDITDHESVAQLFDEEGFDYVFHLAAYAAEGLSHHIRRFNYMNNLIGSVNLINEAVRHRVRHFVFTSSMAVYGTNQLPFREDMVPRPEDPYGIAKYAVELDLAAAHEVFGLNYTIFRPHNVYGEGQNISDKYRNVVAIFMNQLMRGEPMTVFGDGLQTRAFSYIGDVATIIAISPAIKDCNGQVFNIGADRPYTMVELAHVVARSFGVEPEIEHLPPRVEVRHAHCSHDKLRDLFGNFQTTTLEVGIGRMAKWAQAQGPRETPQFAAGIEVPDNLPPKWEPAMSDGRG